MYVFLHVLAITIFLDEQWDNVHTKDMQQKREVTAIVLEEKASYLFGDLRKSQKNPVGLEHMVHMRLKCHH